MYERKPSGMEEYLSNYGWHFSKAMCMWAISMMKDRKGESFEVRCTQRRYSEIYNGKPLYLADKWDEWNSFSFGLLYFTGESPEEIDSVIRSYTETFEKREGVTRGLYYRNVK